jgi:hypothetical protein
MYQVSAAQQHPAPAGKHRFDDPRSAVSGEGRVGGPCHEVTTAGTFCTRRAVTVADDGYGYCKRHAQGQS